MPKPTNIHGKLIAEGGFASKAIDAQEHYHYAGSYDGADPDARLDNALDAAEEGDAIHLENADYTDDRTGSDAIDIENLSLIATVHGFGSSTTEPRFSSNVELAARGMSITGINFEDDSGEYVLSGQGCVIRRVLGRGGTTVEVEHDECAVFECRSLNVVFESATEDGLVDSCIGVDVSGDGNYTEGTIG